MGIFKKEPAILFGVLGALAQMALMYFTTNPLADYAFVVPLLTVVSSWFTRQSVFSSETLRDAGLDPKMVQERADDPSIPKFEAK